MQSNEKPVVVFIDDEERILRVMKKLFRKTHEVFCTTNPSEYIDFIKNNEVHVAVSDQRMPERLGVDILREVKEVSPTTMRILLTGYADLDAIVNSINEGEIFRYLTKPCKSEEMLRIVGRATEIALTKPTESVTVNSAFGTSSEDIAQVINNDNYQKPVVLVLDDDVNVFKDMDENFGDMYHFRWASNLEEAYAHLDEGNISVCIADVHINGDNISPIIYTLKQHAKDIVVLVQTSFRDATQLIDLINKGQVYRCLPKPPRMGLVKISLERAHRHHLELIHTPQATERYEVEQSEEDVDGTSLSSQVKGFLMRIRKRLA